MLVRELMELLSRFDPESEVRLSVSLPGRVIATHENLWVADYGGGPQLHAALDFKQFHVYVGCGMEQLVTNVPPHPFDPSLHDAEQGPSEVDLGDYENEEIAAQVRDFYNYHRRPDQPLKRSATATRQFCNSLLRSRAETSQRSPFFGGEGSSRGILEICRVGNDPRIPSAGWQPVDFADSQ